MKQAIELPDTTFRAFKKKTGAIALHLRTHLIVYADAAFRAKIQEARPTFPLNLEEPMKPSGLSAFFKEHPCCWLQFPGGKPCECEVSYGCYPERRWIERPSGDRWVTSHPEDITDEECVLFFFHIKLIYRGRDFFGKGNVHGVIVANLKMTFDINFPGRTLGEKIIIRRKVPIVRRGYDW